MTGVRLAAEDAGLQTLGIVDQTYFLLGLGLDECLTRPAADAAAELKRRLALKTLLLPGGMGSTHKVMVFGRDVRLPRAGPDSPPPAPLRTAGQARALSL